MKILELSFKNILSYGNCLQTLTFDDEPKLILVEGENGAGKSSIKEALTVSIYGRSAIRKMKDVPNWVNRNAFTNIKFLTNSGDQVDLSRGIDPNFSNIEVNGSHFNLPDKRKVDDFIEEELAKIPFSVFCNTISLSFDDFKSFVNLSQSDKRKIVDRIFGIDILTDMRGIVKEEMRQAKKELDLLNSQISRHSTTLQSSLDQLAQLREKLSKKKEVQSDDLTFKIEERRADLENIKSRYASFKDSISGTQQKLNQVRDEVSLARAAISEVNDKLTLYQKNRCPHCLNDLTSDSATKTKESIELKKKTLDESLPALKESFSTLNSKLEELTDDQNSAKADFYRVKADLESLETSLKKMMEEVATDETNSIEAIIETIQQNLDTDSTQAQTKEKEYELSSTLDSLLSDSGIKKTLIDKIIPTLNARIFEISQKLEFKFSFEFNSDFDPIISYMGLEISPESLSSGQRKKMNLIVLLAFIELIKMKHSQMNVMFLDEIFSSLDKNNVYMAIEILREYSTKYGMTIFVVSHESLPEELFNYRIMVKTVDHFSEMTLTKIG
jgi:DNA repair exonuclease SbcCD ATPase subunit